MFGFELQPNVPNPRILVIPFKKDKIFRSTIFVTEMNSFDLNGYITFKNGNGEDKRIVEIFYCEQECLDILI